MTGVDWDKKGEYKALASQIQVPSELGYTTYYFINDAYVSKTESVPGWADGSGNFVTVDLTPGVAFWFKNKVDDDGSVFTQQGEVPSDDGEGIRIECDESFQLRSNPFPVDFDLNGENVDSSEVIGVNWDKKGDYKSAAAQVQVPSELGYTTYYFLNDAYVSKSESKRGWADGSGNFVAINIPAGQGFWVKGSTGKFGLTFKLNAKSEK